MRDSSREKKTDRFGKKTSRRDGPSSRKGSRNGDGPSDRRGGGRGTDNNLMGRRSLRLMENVKEINPTDYEFLRKFLTDHGKLLPGRFTGTTSKQQRQIKKAIRRARVMGLLP